jgi:hypothetical protein
MGILKKHEKTLEKLNGAYRIFGCSYLKKALSPPCIITGSSAELVKEATSAAQLQARAISEHILIAYYKQTILVRTIAYHRKIFAALQHNQ